jgi:hypothetical protein
MSDSLATQATSRLEEDLTLTHELDNRNHDVEPATDLAGENWFPPHDQAEASLPTLTHDCGVAEIHHESPVCNAGPRRHVEHR